MYCNLIAEKIDEVFYIWFNRPEVRNALNPLTLRELKSVLSEAAKDNQIKVVVISGKGNKAFVSGADIADLQQRSMVETLDAEMQAIFSEIEFFPKPVIAAVNGVALGGGCELVLACDFAIASEKAKFGQPEINIGIMPGAGGTQRLTRLIGKRRAKELILTGKIITAQEAKAFGIVNEVVAHEQLYPAVEKLAHTLCAKPPLALRLAKVAINLAEDTSSHAGLAYEKVAQAVLFGSEDKREGTTAFLEKRQPVFQGK